MINITPPPELLREWCQQGRNCISELDALKALATQAVQWGADQELEAILAELEALHLPYGYAKRLRAARRPKPPSLKEKALLAIDTAVADDRLSAVVADVVRRALEALDD